MSIFEYIIYCIQKLSNIIIRFIIYIINISIPIILLIILGISLKPFHEIPIS